MTKTHRSVRRRRAAMLLAVSACLMVSGLVSSAAPSFADEASSALDPNADVHAFGVAHLGDTTEIAPATPIVAMAALPDGSGYWLAGGDGGVFNFGEAPFLGSLGDLELNQPIVAMASHPSGGGYWLVASDGGVFNFGEAPFLGSLGDLELDEPIVGMAAHPDGGGYWLVAADGGVFAFGSSAFLGSMGGIELNKPVVGMAAHPAGDGYWLVASDGGVFSFGEAEFHGSTGALTLDQPVVAMAATSDASGYWMAAADGGIFAFGTAGFFGSAAGTSRIEPVVAMASPASGDGYWLARAAGPVWPLTAMPTAVVDPRPALAVKIDNSPGARGQWGLVSADVVVEELVEGGVTRFIAVFHSRGASPVGPIRSARETDVSLVPMFGPAVLAFSGGNRTVRSLVEQSPLLTGVLPNDTYGRAFFRTSLRSAPHNLLSRTERLWAFAPPDEGPPPVLFRFRNQVLVEALGVDTTPFLVDFGTRTASWTWDGDSYLRSRGRFAHRDAFGQRIATTNVVVLETTYTLSAATGSPVAQTLGSGDGFVLVDGSVIAISWARTSATEPYLLTDIHTGSEVMLAPGPTWIELVPIGLQPFDGG